MYIGHLGLALVGKGLRHNAPIWLLVAATQGFDWAQAVACVAAPLGESAMWSHSLPVVAVLAVAGFAAYLVTGDAGVASMTGAVALSHVLADYVTGISQRGLGDQRLGWTYTRYRS